MDSDAFSTINRQLLLSIFINGFVYDLKRLGSFKEIFIYIDYKII